MVPSQIAFFDRVFDPITDCFTPDVAQRIINLRADEQLGARLDELAAKSNEGTLTPAEDAEYKRYIDAIDVLSIIQAKARAALAQRSVP